MHPIKSTYFTDFKTGKKIKTKSHPKKAKKGKHKYEVVYYDNGGHDEFAVYRKLYRGIWLYNIVSRDIKYESKRNKKKYPELLQNFKTLKSFQRIQSDETWWEGDLKDILTEYNFEWMYTYHSDVHPDYKNEIKGAVDNYLSYLMHRWDCEIGATFAPINEE